MLSRIATLVCLVPLPALADGAPKGSADAGQSLFARQCATCHVVVNATGETLAGVSGKTGPNLYAVAMRPAGSIEDFRYGASMLEASKAGLTWSEDNFVSYVQGPSAFLQRYLGDDDAVGKMAFKVRNAEAGHDLFAYLSSLAPPQADALSN